MKFIRLVPNETSEIQLNLDRVVFVQVTSTFVYVQLEGAADRLMISAAEWQRIYIYFPDTQFPQIPESETKLYLVNLEYISHIQVSAGMSYLHLVGHKDRIMVKPDVWAQISVLFPAQ